MLCVPVTDRERKQLIVRLIIGSGVIRDNVAHTNANTTHN